MCPVTTDMEERAQIREHECKPTPDRTPEKVRGPQHSKMDTDELLPGQGFCALWSRGNAVTFEDIADRLVADHIPQIGQRTDNAVIAPGAVLASHPHHQFFNLLINTGTSDRLTLWRVGMLLVHALAVPGEDGVGLCNSSDLFEGFLTQLLTKLGEYSAIA